MKDHYLKELLIERNQGAHAGIVSVCSSNAYVIRAALQKAMALDAPVLIEATANQVNQFGGYTGMKPADFVDMVQALGCLEGVPKERILLGGDHLGPLCWQNEPEKEAMEKAEALVRAYAAAGFSKIHLDTSMRLGGDDPNRPLCVQVVANRAVRLAQAVKETVRGSCACTSTLPVLVIGSEVPVPGGVTQGEDALTVTSPSDFSETVHTFRRAFWQAGLAEWWDRVVAVVVQPGVEFGDDMVHAYDRDAASPLMREVANYPNLMLEGHSTDYQSPQALRRMVEDGIAILKVGPALTFHLREALYALSSMERILLEGHPNLRPSRFPEVLEEAMLREPGHWKRYYGADEIHQRYCRSYSLSDRCRYYLCEPDVTTAMEQLVSNLSGLKIPYALLSQYMPVQAAKVQQGILEPSPDSLILSRITDCLDTYAYATERQPKI